MLGEKAYFGSILQRNLKKKTPLKVWNQGGDLNEKQIT